MAIKHESRRRVELIYGTCGCMMPCSCVEFDGKRYRSVVEVVAYLDAQVGAFEDERQAVLDVVNIYGDDVLHSALDNIGWPANYYIGGQPERRPKAAESPPGPEDQA